MHLIMKAIVGSAALIWAGGAAAASLVFSGKGAIGLRDGSLPVTGTAIEGDAFRFRFTFDPDDAVATSTNSDFATFTIPFTAFGAELGRYGFTPAGTTARLTLARGLLTLGGPTPEPGRFFAFSFASALGPGSVGSGAPFADADFEQLSVSAAFRDLDPSRPVSLADLRDPATTTVPSFFDYFASGPGQPPRSGLLIGEYQGGFAAAVVPEPASWIMMIGGFGLIGGAMRRRARIAAAVRFA